MNSFPSPRGTLRQIHNRPGNENQLVRFSLITTNEPLDPMLADVSLFFTFVAGREIDHLEDWKGSAQIARDKLDF